MCFTLLLRRFVKYRYAAAELGGEKVRLMLADSFLKHMLGLMHMRSLAQNEGMLFVFKRDAKYGIWMLNMLFPIDILWLDKDLRIIDIVEGAEPCRNIFGCRTYTPSKEARYVLELNAHASSKLSLHIGSKIRVEGI